MKWAFKTIADKKIFSYVICTFSKQKATPAQLNLLISKKKNCKKI